MEHEVDPVLGSRNTDAFSTESLLAIRKDLHEVIAAQEAMNREGLETPKLGEYWDALFAVAGELRRRGVVIHSCPVDGAERLWEDLAPRWVGDDFGLDGSSCTTCGSTFTQESA